MKKTAYISLLILSLLSGCDSSAKNPTTNKEFDDQNIIFTAPVISDEHVGYKDATINNKENFDKALKTLKGLSTRSFDAVLSAGDQTQDGTQANIDELMEVYENNFDLDETPFVFAHGNHDSYWTGCLDLPGLYSAYGENVYKFDLDKTQAKLGNRHVKINGIHFVTLQVKTFMPNINDFTAETVNWFDATMEAIEADTPNMPIIVLCHSPIKNTVSGSLSTDDCGDWGASTQLQSMVENHPNIILISGHTHYGITDERNIMQDTVTAINAGSICDLDLDIKIDNVTELDNRRQYSFGAIMEIDKNGNTRYTRYDLKQKKQIKQPWIISAPKADGSHLVKYSLDYRTENNIEPTFKEGGTCYYKESATGNIELVFDAFQSNDMIFMYEVRIYDESFQNIADDGDCLSCARYMEHWYDYPTPRTGLINLVTKTRYSNKYTVKLSAVDSFGGSCSVIATQEA